MIFSRNDAYMKEREEKAKLQQQRLAALQESSDNQNQKSKSA